MCRLRRGAVTLLWMAGSVGVLVAGVPAHASSDDCATVALGEAVSVEASMRLEAEVRDAVKLVSSVRVTVPHAWQHSRHLLGDWDSGEYRHAMACVLGYKSQGSYGMEDRLGRPSVSVDASGTTVVDVVSARRPSGSAEFRVGAWSIDWSTGGARFTLLRSEALTGARWSVRFEAPATWLAGMEPWPPTDARDGVVRWADADPAVQTWVSIKQDPPVNEVLAAEELPWTALSGLTIWIFDAVLLGWLLVSVRRLRRPEETLTSRRTLRVVLLVPVGILFMPLLAKIPPELGWHPPPGHPHYVNTIGWTAVLLWGMWASGLPRALLAAGATLAVVASVALPLILASFAVPGGSAEARGWEVAGGWLLMSLAAVAACYRLARSLRGEDDVPRLSTPHFMRTRSGRLALAVGPLVAALVIWQRFHDADSDYQRLHWLSTDLATRSTDVFNDATSLLLENFFSSSYAIAYVVGVFTVLPVLLRLASGPDLELAREVRVVCCLGYAVVAYSIGDLWGGWWFPVGMAVGIACLLLLTGSLARSRAPLWAAYDGYSQEEIIAAVRARRQREGQDAAGELAPADGGPEGTVASKPTVLARIAGWLRPDTRPRPDTGPAAISSGDGPPQPLPGRLTPLDVLFGIGPFRSAYANGRHAAKLALLFGTAAGAWLLWREWQVADWMRPNEQYFLTTALLSELLGEAAFWGAQGFALGVLWRVLPGCKGPAKATALGLVNAATIGAEWLLNSVLRENPYEFSLLRSVLVFVVLSAVAVAMDLATARQLESPGVSRWRIVMSGYSLGNLPGQATFILAQLAALLAIWHYVRSGAEPPQFPSIDPTKIGQR